MFIYFNRLNPTSRIVSIKYFVDVKWTLITDKRTLNYDQELYVFLNIQHPILKIKQEQFWP